MKEAAAAASLPELGNREDLRTIPLVTIDGEDAKDFDDAVFAEPAPENCWRIIVAIADVSTYVQSGDILDNESQTARQFGISARHRSAHAARSIIKRLVFFAPT